MKQEINGDHPLDRIQRQRYIWRGFSQIWNHRSHCISLNSFFIEVLPAFLEAKLSRCISPLRIYTDCLLDDVIQSYCPANITMLDLGCGKGDYSTFFDRAGYCGLYVGLDVVSNPFWYSWLKQSPVALRRAFVKAEAETLPLGQASINFAVSSCALEHFTNDVLAVERLSESMRPGAYSIHFVPSVWSLFLYVYHGYRRYSPAVLLEMFQNADFEIVKLWALGGVSSFLLHCVWITWFETGLIWEILTLGGSPLPGLQNLLSKFKIGPYVRQGPRFVVTYNYLLRLCLKLDRYLPFLPGGYAILIRKPSDG